MFTASSCLGTSRGWASHAGCKLGDDLVVLDDQHLGHDRLGRHAPSITFQVKTMTMATEPIPAIAVTMCIVVSPMRSDSRRRDASADTLRTAVDASIGREH